MRTSAPALETFRNGWEAMTRLHQFVLIIALQNFSADKVIATTDDRVRQCHPLLQHYYSALNETGEKVTNRQLGHVGG